MNFEKIAQYDDDKGLTLDETIWKMNDLKMRIPSSLEQEQNLIHSEEWKKETEMYPCRTGTLFISEIPDTPFGETVEWDGYKVLVPKEFQGKKNIALVCNHPDFSFSQKTFSSDKFVGIEIPKENNWYLPESKFRIPNGKKSKESDKNARYFYRRTGRPFIGLVVRGCVVFGDRRDVGCYDVSDVRFGVFGVKEDGKTIKHEHNFVCECGCKQ